MEGDALRQLDYIWVHINIVQDIRDHSILLAKLALVVQQLPTFFQRHSEVPNDLGQRLQVVLWSPKTPQSVVLQLIIRPRHYVFNVLEVGVEAVECGAKFDISLRFTQKRLATFTYGGVQPAQTGRGDQREDFSFLNPLS